MTKRYCDQDDDAYYASKRQRQEPLGVLQPNLLYTPQRQRVPPLAEAHCRGAPSVVLGGWEPQETPAEGRHHPTLATTPPPSCAIPIVGASQPYEEPFAFMPTSALTGGLVVPLRQPHHSRSPSICTNTTEGLSEDSVFSTDAANVNFLHRSNHHAHLKECGLGAPSAVGTPLHSQGAGRGKASASHWNTDAQKWQNELNAFFSRLDARPLRVAGD